MVRKWLEDNRIEYKTEDFGFSFLFQQGTAKYLQKLDLKPDYNAREMGHLYIVSYDPELYYNPNAESLTIDLEETKRSVN